MKIEMPLMPLSSLAWGSRFALSLAVMALAGQITLNGQTVAHFVGARTNVIGPDYGSANGSANFSGAQFNGPNGLAFDVTGRFLYVADVTNRAVRRLDTISKVVSTPIQFTNAVFPMDVATDRSSNVYVLTTGDGLIRIYRPNGSQHVLLATNNATALINPTAMAFDKGGNIYVTESGGAVKFIATNGVVSTVAGITNLINPQGIEVLDSLSEAPGIVAIADTGNHVIRLYNPANSNYVVFAGQLGANGTDNGATTNAQFSSPCQISKAGDNILIVADYGNHQVRKVDAGGNVSLFYGHLPWFTTGSASDDLESGIWPGNQIGTGGDEGIAEAREPRGVLVDGNGNVYVAENYYHVIRKVTDTGLSGPAGTSTGGGTQLPQVAPPTIGIAVYNEVSGEYSFTPITTSSALSPATFYTNAIVVITSSEVGVQTLYTVGGSTNSVFNAVTPSSTVGQPAPPYQTNQPSQPISVIDGQIQPFVIVRAISVQTGRTNSPVVEAVFNFKTTPPSILGNNAASFTVANQTTNVAMFYTTDGTDPVNNGPNRMEVGDTLSFNLEFTNMLFKVRAFKDNYEASTVASNYFTTNNFLANKISFGFESGEASSDFTAAPGQTFMAPVTLSLLAAQKIYSLQFNLQVTNNPGSGAPPVALGAVGFESMLEKSDPDAPGIFIRIPPAMFLGLSVSNQVILNGVTSTVFTAVNSNLYVLETNQSCNLLGLGWLERKGFVFPDPNLEKLRLYNPSAQDLVTYSRAHDQVFPNNLNPGKVIVGGYKVQMPANSTFGHTYTIRIGRPSATADGMSEDVFIQGPSSTNLPNTGTLKAERTITIGSRLYVVGDVTPFRWFNAGDFGDTNQPSILNNDVLQTFQSAVYNWNNPPAGTDFYDAMDSANGMITGLMTSNVNTAVLDAMVFGDGFLNVNDVFVTFQRSLDPVLKWVARYWTNVGGVSYLTNTYVTNQFRGGSGNAPARTLAAAPAAVTTSSEEPFVKFVAQDAEASAGQFVQIPLWGRIKGGLPVKILMQNITIEPLDGAPPIAQPIGLIPASGLGQPSSSTAKGPGNLASLWLDQTVAGVSGTNILGSLFVTLPTNMPPGSAYGVRFDRISASPNGLGVFPQAVEHGLITLGSRTNSSWGDGIPDNWRLRHFGTISNHLSHASADADGDGVPNWAEHRAGTSPVDSTSNLRLLSAQALGGGALPPTGMTLTVPTVEGKTYVLEYSSSLFGASWTTVTNFTGTGVNVSLQDNSNSTGEPRFYRVRLQE